jgi:dTDP-glucose pyrophosphorylase
MEGWRIDVGYPEDRDEAEERLRGTDKKEGQQRNDENRLLKEIGTLTYRYQIRSI